MLTKRKKLKNRKKIIQKIIVFLTVILTVGISCGYLIYLKLFPKATYISPLAINIPKQIPDQEEGDITFIKNLLKIKEVPFVSIKTIGTSYVISMQDKSEVTLSSEKDLRMQISSLQFILSQLKMEGRRFLRLDLSFDKPIVVFQ